MTIQTTPAYDQAFAQLASADQQATSAALAALLAQPGLIGLHSRELYFTADRRLRVVKTGVLRIVFSREDDRLTLHFVGGQVELMAWAQHN